MPVTVLPKQPGFFETLLDSMMKQQQLSLQREQLEQQKEAQKLREREIKISEQEAARQAQQAQSQDLAGQAVLQFLTQQNPALAQSIGQQFPQTTADLSQLGNAQVPSQQVVNQPFQAANLPAGTAGPIAGGIQQAQQTAADIALAQSQARVAEATETATIETKNLAPALARGELGDLQAMTRGRELQNSYQALLNKRDPARVNQARLLFETGAITWGQARETAGLPEDVIPDNTVFVPPGSTQQNAEALRNQGFAQMMQVSNGIINQLSAQGVRLGFLPSLQRQTQSATFDAVLNLVAGTDQERLVNAQRMFGDAYRFSLSGQQSSDREALRMLNSIAEQVGDSEETIAQKRTLREVMINVTRMKAGGGIDAVRGAQMGLAAAKNTGDSETITLFEEILQETIDQEAGVGLPSGLPTDETNLPDRIQDVDNLIDTGLSGRGMR